MKGTIYGNRLPRGTQVKKVGNHRSSGCRADVCGQIDRRTDSSDGGLGAFRKYANSPNKRKQQQQIGNMF
jgi:hypothetical protein